MDNIVRETMQAKSSTLPWTEETWNRIHTAVQDEVRRVAIAPKFLPLCSVEPDALTEPSHGIAFDEQNRLWIDEAPVVRIIELWSDFALTPQQVEEEDILNSARTLAIRAANFITRARDAVIFRGDAAFSSDPLFIEDQEGEEARVHYRSNPAGRGLLATEPDQVITVEALNPGQQNEPGQPKFGENTFTKVAEAYKLLQDQGHYGPYALVLNQVPYGDTFAPRPSTLVLPADRILSLVTKGFYGTGNLPDLCGILVSVGGESMDLVIGREPTTTFLFEDENGKFRFRVLTRFALRLKKPSAVVALDFQLKSNSESKSKRKKQGAERS